MITPLHQGISVPDADASIEWYRSVLGFRLVSDSVAAPLNSRIVFMELGGFQLELFEYLGADGKPLPPERREPNEDIKTCGTKHVAYRTDDMAALVRGFEEKGVDIVMPPFPMENDLVCFIRDNSGVLLEFIAPGGNRA